MQLEKVPLGYELRGFSLNRIFDLKFLGLLKQEGLEVAVDHITFRIDDNPEKKSPAYVTIGFLTKKNREENKVTITATTSTSLEFMINSIEKLE